MSIVELLLITFSLSLDALTVSVGAGALNRMNVARALRIAGIFGLFHAVLLVAGWLLGLSFSDSLMQYSRYIGFVLILFVGLKMLKESFTSENSKKEKDILHLKTLLLLAVATSIDAFVIGVTFTFIEVNLLLAVLMIGLITFAVSLLGIYLGAKSRHLIGTKIELVGALVLIALAFKVLLF